MGQVIDISWNNVPICPWHAETLGTGRNAAQLKKRGQKSTHRPFGTAFFQPTTSPQAGSCAPTKQAHATGANPVGCPHGCLHGLGLCRRTLSEAGGLNLYGIGQNNLIGMVDPFGMEVKGTFNMANGVVTVKDVDTGATASADAFSGNRRDANNPNSESKRDTGPVPRGNYDILDHPMKDWYALDGPDRTRDDYDQERKRGKFRLHLGTASDGCITVLDDRSPKDYHGNPNINRAPNNPNAKNWDRIRDILNSTRKSTITDAFKKKRTKYGTMTVVYEP